jgi:ketosteroid isomerase-like protein
MQVLEKELTSLIHEYFQAFTDKDFLGMLELTSDEFTYCDHEGRQLNKTAYFDSLGKDEWVTETFFLENLQVHTSEEATMALATYESHFDGHSGDVHNVHLHFSETLVWRKEAGQWKILRMHYSLIAPKGAL